MLTLKGYIAERFVNAIGTRDLETKKKYQKQVWDLLQYSYKAIGGIKGNGFESPDAILNLPMWKMVVNQGKVEAVVIYKDKGGRKSVAIGCTGSDYAKKHVANIMKAELSRSYGEKSKAALGSMMKTVPWDALEPFVQTPDTVAKMNKRDVITPVAKVKDLPDDAKMTLNKYPHLRKYGYMRDISGTPTFKVMFGSPGKSIR